SAIGAAVIAGLGAPRQAAEIALADDQFQVAGLIDSDARPTQAGGELRHIDTLLEAMFTFCSQSSRVSSRKFCLIFQSFPCFFGAIPWPRPRRANGRRACGTRLR